MRSSDGDAVISRAFRLLSAFSPDRAELTLDELAESAGLARSTAHRLAVQLVAQRALERSPRGWRLGVRLFELGESVPRQQRLRDLALAHLEDLYEATRETVHLAVRDGDQVLYVEILSGHRKVASPSRRGGRMPLHCTAVGKTLLAFSPDGGRALLAGVPPLTPRTPHTLTDPGRLLAELHDVRRTGLAHDREEASPGLICVAAPILAPNATARAALSVSMPADGPLTLAQATPALRATARALARELNRAGPVAL
jgi:DNA-binding IclR family transcriptional regulator